MDVGHAAAPAVVAPDRQSDRHVPGEVGAWVFILGDMVLFAIFFATYLAYRAVDVTGYNAAQQALNPDYGAANTAVLLLSSLFVVLAVRAVREQRPGAPGLILGAVACGLAFSALKIVEWTGKISAGLTPLTHEFYMYFYVLTGLHWLHLLIGLLALGALYVLSRRPELSPRQFAFYEGGACFWHMVDLLWIALFPLLYLVR